MNHLEDLFLSDEKSYGPSYKEHLLEQYKLAVEMADNVSSRRQSSNRFFLTIITALIAVMGAATTQQARTRLDLIWVLAVSLSGIVLCLAWHFTIVSYKQLNESKFSIINKIEERLPASIFSEEWQQLNKGSNYKPLTTVEKYVPWVFLTLHLLMLSISTCMIVSLT